MRRSVLLILSTAAASAAMTTPPTAPPAATKDQAESDIIILNPDLNRPVDTTPLYTDAGGCVVATHQY